MAEHNGRARVSSFLCPVGYLLLIFTLTWHAAAAGAPDNNTLIDRPFDDVFTEIYLNHPSGTQTHAGPHANKDFRKIIADFFSVRNIRTHLREFNRVHSRRLSLQNVIIYYSIYEFEDPDIVRSLINAYRQGVSIVIITDRINASRFELPPPSVISNWTEAQRAFYTDRYDINRDGVVDAADVAEIEYRSRLMKTALDVLNRNIEHIGQTHKNQYFKLVLSPYQHVPPENLLYMPLHHPKIRMLTVQGQADPAPHPMSALIGTNNDTFSGTRGDLKESFKDVLARPENFLTRDINADSFIKNSLGNVNLLMKIKEPRLLRDILNREILDSIRAYEAGDMFTPGSATQSMAARHFTLSDGSRVEINFSRGRPVFDDIGRLVMGYDPNTQIVDFLKNANQSVLNINRVVQANFFFSHPEAARSLQNAIARYNPQYLGIFDHSSSFQVYSTVPFIAGVSSVYADRHGTPKMAISPYGMLRGNHENVFVYTNPHDKMHLKLFMVEYEAYAAGAVREIEKRYRIFVGSLNFTKNGANNREILFSIDTCNPRMFNVLNAYVKSVSQQPFSKPFTHSYSLHILRSLFRLPPVRIPQTYDAKPAWEKAITSRRVRDFETAVITGDMAALEQTLRRISSTLSPYSAFAESEAFEAAIRLLRVMWTSATPDARSEKNRWFFVDFISNFYNRALTAAEFRHIQQYFFRGREHVIQVRKADFEMLALDHAQLTSAFLRGLLAKVSTYMPSGETRAWLFPKTPSSRQPYLSHMRNLFYHAFTLTDVHQIDKIIRGGPWKRNSGAPVMRELALKTFDIQAVPVKVRSYIFLKLLRLFADPIFVMNTQKVEPAIQDILKAHDAPETLAPSLFAIFKKYQALAARSPNFPPTQCND